MWVAVGMVLLSLPVGAQGLSLEECQRLAWTNYPLLKKYNLIEQTTGEEIVSAAATFTDTSDEVSTAVVFQRSGFLPV